eukprot:1159136-Pelagomonas_calceolata.AAC.6
MVAQCAGAKKKGPLHTTPGRAHQARNEKDVEGAGAERRGCKVFRKNAKYSTRMQSFNKDGCTHCIKGVGATASAHTPTKSTAACSHFCRIQHAHCDDVAPDHQAPANHLHMSGAGVVMPLLQAPTSADHSVRIVMMLPLTTRLPPATDT